jgi:uncharacterized protein DUF4199
MKKIVLVFGLVSGGLMAVFMYATLPLVDKVGFEKLTFLGYAAMVLAFILVFFGIRSYRENIGGGTITFGRAFTVGILIALISSVCYVVAWLIMYSVFLPDFLDKYTTYVIEQMRASGAAPEAVQAKIQEMEQAKRLYSNPFLRAAFTFIEPFPVGLIMTLISALILRKKKPAPAALATAEH